MLRGLVAACVLFLVLGEAHAEKRVALVIGNSGYKLISPLANPRNDAELMAATLKDVGFEVVVAVDVDYRALRKAVSRFGKVLRSAGKDAVGLLYYAGHGVQARGQNYLIPLNAEIDSTADLELEALSASDILAQMEEAGNRLNLVILDACRNNPLPGKVRSAGRGLARIQAASGSLIAFAAAPGQVAADGDGANSPYTAALVQAMKQPGLSVEQVFKKVRVSVEDQTNQRQTPWEESSLRGDFYFVPGAPAAPQGQTSQGNIDDKTLELSFWNSIKDSKNVAAFEEFLRQFPAGTFAGLAKVKIAELRTEVAVGVFPQSAVQPGTPAKRSYKPGDTFKDCDECPEMVVIPAGKFTMGSPNNEKERDKDEGPQLEVKFKNSFAVGKFEVTFSQWEACVADGWCGSISNDWGWGRRGRPVIGVSWVDAKAYIRWLNSKADGSPYRLLSEAEWEYAARAGSRTRFSFGSNEDQLCDYANGADRTAKAKFKDWNVARCADGHVFTAPAGSFEANEFGLHDMHGNVWEWVQDCWTGSYRGAPKDGAARVIEDYDFCPNKVLRGGSWDSAPKYLRSAERSSWHSSKNSNSIGFRVAKTLNP